jgi:hypothetical protein
MVERSSAYVPKWNTGSIAVRLGGEDFRAAGGPVDRGPYGIDEL